MARVRLTRLHTLGLIFLALALSGHAYDETRDPWIRGIFTGRSPRAERCAEADAWRSAIELVSRTPGAFILVGTGRSMLPLYPAGTLLVLRDAEFSDLRSGQTVVYRNTRERAVGHVLVAKARDGWRVRGLNNRNHDLEPVTDGNLIGVVIAAYQPQAEPARARTASRRTPARAYFLSDGEQ